MVLSDDVDLRGKLITQQKELILYLDEIRATGRWHERYSPFVHLYVDLVWTTHCRAS